MSLFAPALFNVWKAIESYGIDPTPLFDAENVKIEFPIDPCLRISMEIMDRILSRAVKLTGDEAFGIRQATCYLPSQLGALGYAMQASMNLRGACTRLE